MLLGFLGVGTQELVILGGMCLVCVAVPAVIATIVIVVLAILKNKEPKN
jgi:uncharacterized membrane protein